MSSLVSAKGALEVLRVVQNIGRGPKMTTDLLKTLVRGRRYRVTYRNPRQRRDHTLVAVYLDVIDAKQEHATLYFVVRPKGGTRVLDLKHVLKAEEVPATTKCMVD